MTIPPDLADRSPLQARSKLRVCQIRSTESTAASALDAIGGPITHAFDLGRLNRSINAATDLAPRIAASADRAELTLTGARWASQQPVRWQRLRIDIAGGGLVDVRLLAIRWTSLQDTVALLEDLFYETLDGEPATWDDTEISDPGPGTENVKPFHQLVFLPDEFGEPEWETIQRLIYRIDLDAREEYSSIARPDELNRRPGKGAAVGSFGSVIWGQQNYIEAGLILSASLTVSATGSLQVTRAKAHTALRGLHALASDEDQDVYSTTKLRQRLRNDLVETQETISLLEAELTFGAEASATLVPLLPSLRIESYHQALYEAADISRQALLVDRMLSRLRAGAEAELSALSTVESSLSALRTRRWSIGAQALAAVTIPLSSLFTYFGVSTGDVTRDTSVLDLREHWAVYLGLIILVTAIAFLIIVLQLRDRRRVPRSSRASRYYQAP